MVSLGDGTISKTDTNQSTTNQNQINLKIKEINNHDKERKNRTDPHRYEELFQGTLPQIRTSP